MVEDPLAWTGLTALLLVSLLLPAAASQPADGATETRLVEHLYYREASASAGPFYAVCGPTYARHGLASEPAASDEEARIPVPASQSWLGCDLRFAYRAGGEFVFDGNLGVTFSVVCDGPAVTTFDPYVRVYRDQFEVVANTPLTGGPAGTACVPGQRLDFNVSLPVYSAVYTAQQTMSVAIEPQAVSDSASGDFGAFFVVETGPDAGRLTFGPPLNITTPKGQRTASSGAAEAGDASQRASIVQGIADAASQPLGLALAVGGAGLACVGLVAWRVARRRGSVVQRAVDAIKQA
jgi:hypothetical protein